MRKLIVILLLSTCLSGEASEATYYHKWFINRKMSNGQRYNPKKLTAAHMTLPLGSIVEVVHKRNGRRIRVKITDRGGFNPRNIDLSYRAFGILDKHSKGRIPVKIKVISKY